MRMALPPESPPESQPECGPDAQAELLANLAPGLVPNAAPAPRHCPPLDAHLEACLLDAARQAQTRAYAPYSQFRVGAAVLDDAGQVHAGCNVENAAYPEGVCAEASALSAMVLAGGRSVRALLLVGDGDALVTPCGGCRQKLREFAAPDTPVLIADADRLRARFTLAQLLPESFGPGHLAR